jgi:hypothetical protein
MTFNLTEDRPMRLSTIPNNVFWPIWSVLLAGVAAAFTWGLSAHHEPERSIGVLTFVAGMIVLCLSAGLRHNRRAQVRTSPAARRYLMRFLPAMALYGLALFGAIWLYQHHKPTGVLAYLVALAPALPIMGAIWAVGRFFIEEDDEFQRKIMIESYLWATGATLAICTVVGFLQAFDLVQPIQLWTVFPLLAVCLVPAQGWVRWKYR